MSWFYIDWNKFNGGKTMTDEEIKQDDIDVTNFTSSDKYPDKDKPIIESSFTVSRDGNWFITKTTITTIKHKNYVKKILGE